MILLTSIYCTISSFAQTGSRPGWVRSIPMTAPPERPPPDLKPWDAIFKQIIKDKVEMSGPEVHPGVQAGKLPREMDLLILKKDPVEDRDGPLSSFLRALKERNIVQFKGPTDPFLPDEDFSLLIGSTGLHSSTEKLAVKMYVKIRLFIISSSDPVKFRKDLEEAEISVEPVGEGWDHFHAIHDVHLIVINRLPTIPEHYPFLLFASGKKRRDFIRKILQERAEEYIAWTSLFYYDEVVETARAENLPLEFEGPKIAKSIELLGIGKVINSIGLARVIEEVGLARVIEDLGRDALDRQLRALPEKDLKQLRELLDAIR